MAKYRKKPVVIEAIQWKGTNLDEVKKFMNKEDKLSYHALPSGNLPIFTLEGRMDASIGDFIIKGVQGEFYPCKPDIFEQTYEEVTEPERLVVEKYERTCIACPSQWDIWTIDGKYIYGRYRWGHFTLTLDAFSSEKEEKELMSWHGEDWLDGTMDDEEMIEITKQVLDWSKVLPLEENKDSTPMTGKMINLSVLIRTFPGFVWWDNGAELCGLNFETKQFIVIEDGMCVSYPNIDHFYSWCCHGYNLPEIPEDWKKLKYCASDDKYMEEWKQLTF